MNEPRYIPVALSCSSWRLVRRGLVERNTVNDYTLAVLIAGKLVARSAHELVMIAIQAELYMGMVGATMAIEGAVDIAKSLESRYFRWTEETRASSLPG